jgi:hypothetical protein
MLAFKVCARNLLNLITESPTYLCEIIWCGSLTTIYCGSLPYTTSLVEFASTPAVHNEIN